MHHKFLWPSFDFHIVILWSVYEFHVTIIWPFHDLHGTIIWPLNGIYIMTFKVFRCTQNVGQWPLHENKVLIVWMLMFLYWFYGGTRLTRQIVSHMTRSTTKKAPPSGLKNLSKKMPPKDAKEILNGNGTKWCLKQVSVSMNKHPIQKWNLSSLGMATFG